MNISLNTYIEDHTDDADKVLIELDRQTHLQFLNPRMSSGYYQGKVLEMISSMVRPKNILEIGTFSGYSAISLVKGIQNDGVLVTIDINDETEVFVNKYVKKAGLENVIKLIIGNAIDEIPKLDINFDLVFIDADKVNYINYYNLIFDKVNTGGFIVVDNVLWDGKVVEPLTKNDIQTKAILEFNNLVKDDTRVETIILPIRDGLSILRKK